MDKVIDGKIVGEKTGARITKRWVPKEWRTEYEAMVALSCTGLSNEEVGKRFGYGKQQVSNIINTPAGKKLKEILLARLRLSNEESFTERISTLQEKALKNIEEVMNEEELLGRAPLAMFDRSAKFLSNTTAKGFRSDGLAASSAPQVAGSVNIQNNTVIVNGVSRDALAEAVNKSNRVKELSSGLVGTSVEPARKVESGTNRFGEEVRHPDNGRVEVPEKVG